MKKTKTVLSLILITALAFTALIGCSADKKTAGTSEDPASAEGFSYSNGIDKNGFWEKISAADYVKLSEYKGISVPSDIHNITDEALQAEVDKVLADYSTEKQITDRAVADGETVNIDYTGSIDGVAFEGGSTNGSGTEVTIGVTSYIDDFLEQLIGHTPGESFDVNVTFPADYGKEELNGKDAVFAVKLNYIVEKETPELTDGFVAEKLSSNYGWNTVQEMKSAMKSNLQSSAIASYIHDYLIENMTIESLPDSLLDYQEASMIKYYQDNADAYSMKLDEFLTAYAGVSSTDELLKLSLEENTRSAQLYLIIQAIAEDAGISVSNDDVTEYFKKYMGAEDYSEYEKTYGMPYLKLNVLNQTVMDYLQDNAVLE
jgi:trigger factor